MDDDGLCHSQFKFMHKVNNKHAVEVEVDIDFLEGPMKGILTVSQVTFHTDQHDV